MTTTAGNRPLAPYLEGKTLNKVEQNKAARDGLDLAGDLERFAQAGWQAIDETDLQLRLKWFGLFWRPVTPGQFMLRLRVPNGIISSEQLRAVASIVARYGSDGSCDITTRQNLQLRGVLLEDFPEILERLKEVGLTSIQSGFDNPRNVTGNPLAGIDPHEIVDTRPYTQELQDFLVGSGKGNRSFSNLPRKWNTAVAGSKDNFLLHNDIVFHPVERDGVMGFGVWVGGILSSQMNAYALPLNAWVPPHEICRLTDAVIGLWRDHGERKNRPKGRFRFYLDGLGIEAFRAQVVERFGPLAEDPGSVFDATPRQHLGLHPQKQEGLLYAGLHVPVGRLKAVDLQDLAALSESFGDGEVRLTEDQNVILSGIPASRSDALAAEPLLQRFPMHPGSVSAGTVSCTGKTYCGFALTNTKDTAMGIARELDRELELPEEVRIHWTGCPNSCGQAYMGAIGLTGTKAKSADGELGEGYDITIGGSQGADPQIGTSSRKKVPANEVKQVVRDLLIEHYGARPRAM
ncbi:ferredoxin--nitrite reductase [Synechococcus sp. RSCCF101]|uniref:ferredoxin--nitrite reductase n=1 Tax=Synechococcus sp. RSCCF101 TaxID=2511069 RepID=UPI001248E286|nr:ferredoxin--nitrite reductase [Synechococcus sp. RSCCF101]QEY32623.1 ferredoxin--nitrite reductase [Synechococcus sp. RSCCF101]